MESDIRSLNWPSEHSEQHALHRPPKMIPGIRESEPLRVLQRATVHKMIADFRQRHVLRSSCYRPEIVQIHRLRLAKAVERRGEWHTPQLTQFQTNELSLFLVVLHR